MDRSVSRHRSVDSDPSYPSSPKPKKFLSKLFKTTFHRLLNSGCLWSLLHQVMDVEERIDIAESSNGDELVEHEGDGMVVEPHDGMEFESEDAAKMFE
ncbi:hypothetical protein DKX38_026521 [Salix brachista]|uniref:Uncharacterized protein n=1 Tax=Salix brachista TaxID=2182728 RepID=A0A5N5JF06_9ROSI|nr:hypothetical protein DKX38_026521 [Salix brachista]